MLAARWVARIVGLSLVGFVSVFAVAHRLDPTTLTGTELAMMGAWLVALIGMLALWCWEFLGGALVVAAVAAFYLINFVASGRLPGGPIFALHFLPGLLALACGAHATLQDKRSGAL